MADMKQVMQAIDANGKVQTVYKKIVDLGGGLYADATAATLSGSKAKRAVVIVVDTDIAETSAITVNVDTEASIIFIDDESPVNVKLLAGYVYPYIIKRVITGENIIGLY